MSYCTKFSWIPAWSLLLLHCAHGLFWLFNIYNHICLFCPFKALDKILVFRVGVRVEQAAAEDWQGGGGEGQVRPAEVHAPGTAQGKAGTAPGTAQGKAWC